MHARKPTARLIVGPTGGRCLSPKIHNIMETEIMTKEEWITAAKKEARTFRFSSEWISEAPWNKMYDLAKECELGPEEYIEGIVDSEFGPNTKTSDGNDVR